MHADELTQYADHTFNRSYVNWKQNKTNICCAKNKATFTAVNISIGSGHRNIFCLDIGT